MQQMQQGLILSKVDKWSSLRNQICLNQLKWVALVTSYFDRGGGNSVGNNCPLRRGGHSASKEHIFAIFKVFCVFCKPYTYSYPFLTTLVSFKKIWPIYGYSHFLEAKK